MAAYLIGIISRVKDPAGFAEYAKLALPTLEQYGGKVMAVGNKIEVADGSWSPVGAIVVQFENLQRAKEWSNSPEYSAVKGGRFLTAESGVIFLDGG